MTSSPYDFDLSSVRLGDDVRRLAGLSLALDDDDYVGLLVEGTWWTRPFARWYDFLLALRLEPGRPPAECAVVAVYRGEAVTLASSPAAALPVQLWAARLRTGTDEWRKARERWPHVEGELAALHAALGGTDGLAA